MPRNCTSFGLRFGLFLIPIVATAGQSWPVRVEEPTGIYRRDGEVVRVPLAKFGGNRSGFTVTDERGREVPWQVTEAELLFPATATPGDLPVYRVYCCSAEQRKYTSQILARKIGMRRVEFGNA